MPPRKRYLSLILLIVLSLFTFCSRQQDSGTRVLVCPKGLTHDFWLTVKAGADSSGKELGVNAIWKGPAVETDIAGQIAIIEDYINKRVDAIVMAACDTKALIPVVEEARRQGIPVITIDSGLDSEVPLSFVASDNVVAAEKAAHKLAELIGGKGDVACVNFIPGAATSIWREEGFKKGLGQYPEINLVALQYCQADVATAMAVTENILTAQPGLKGIFAANEASAIGAAQALVARDLQAKVKLVAFDASPNEIKAMQNGVIQALLVQNPFAMGYMGVRQAVAAIQGKPVEKRIDTGVTVITMENYPDPEIQKLLYPLGKE